MLRLFLKSHAFKISRIRNFNNIFTTNPTSTFYFILYQCERNGFNQNTDATSLRWTHSITPQLSYSLRKPIFTLTCWYKKSNFINVEMSRVLLMSIWMKVLSVHALHIFVSSNRLPKLDPSVTTWNQFCFDWLDNTTFVLQSFVSTLRPLAQLVHFVKNRICRPISFTSSFVSVDLWFYSWSTQRTHTHQHASSHWSGVEAYQRTVFSKSKRSKMICNILCPLNPMK